MALTQLSDVIVPEIYLSYTAVNGPEKTAFWQSGAVVQSDLINAKANGGGKIVELPFWKDLDASQEANISDDTANAATPQKVVAGEQVARNVYLNQGYSAADLAGEIAGSSPMQQVRNRFGVYWQRQFQRRLIATAQGVFAADTANDDSSMTVSIAAQATADVAASTQYSREAFVNAAMTLGDNFDSVTAIAVHSVIYGQMVKNDDIEFIPDSQGELTIPTYLGRRIIVDDGMPAVSGTTDPAAVNYTSVLFGAGAFGYGEGNPNMPVEVYRLPNQGNGAGVEQVWERKTWILHPFGYQFNSASVAGASPTIAELKLAANWSRVIERKNVPLAALITN